MCDKKCVRYTVAAVGIALVMLGLFSMSAGVNAANSQELELLGLNKRISASLVFSGATMVITAGIGWAAASTKNEPLSFIVSSTIYLTLS